MPRSPPLTRQRQHQELTVDEIHQHFHSHDFYSDAYGEPPDLERMREGSSTAKQSLPLIRSRRNNTPHG